MTAAVRVARLGATGPGSVRVTRSRRSNRWSWLVTIAVIGALGYLPYATDSGTTAVMINFFILLTMAAMWNLLAGYAGLVSVGQQAFVGFGAYTVLVLAQNGFSPFAAIPVAAIVCGALALPISWLVFRLRGGYFAIATWVVADVAQLLMSQVPQLGGGTGAALPGLFNIDPAWITAYTYWASLAVAVATLGAIYVVLRSRVGLALTAIRDNEVGARSVGVQVSLAKRIVYAVSSAGAGAAGALVAVSQLNVQAASVFSVQWSAYMIFVVIIGGIGSIEGPILGAILFFVLQQSLSQYGAWYLIVVGLMAIVVALRAPRGLWGVISDRFHVSLFNTGYWLWPGTNGTNGTDAASKSDGESAAAGGEDAAEVEAAT